MRLRRPRLPRPSARSVLIAVLIVGLMVVTGSRIAANRAELDQLRRIQANTAQTLERLDKLIADLKEAQKRGDAATQKAIARLIAENQADHDALLRAMRSGSQVIVRTQTQTKRVCVRPNGKRC